MEIVLCATFRHISVSVAEDRFDSPNIFKQDSWDSFSNIADSTQGYVPLVQ